MEKDLFQKDFEAAVSSVFTSQKVRIVYHDFGFHELFVESIIWTDELVQLREYIDVQFITFAHIDHYMLCIDFVFKDH